METKNERIAREKLISIEAEVEKRIKQMPGCFCTPDPENDDQEEDPLDNK